MIFVPTDILYDTDNADNLCDLPVKFVCKFDEFSDTGEDINYYLDSDNNLRTNDGYIVTPILLQCPHCKAQILQQETVTCENCGLVMEAISDSMYEKFLTQGYENINAECIGIYMDDEYLRWFIFNINNIHWLLISEGK